MACDGDAKPPRRRSCCELAQRYELVRQELAGAVLLNETLGAPSARAMEKLSAAISAEEAHAGVPRSRRFAGSGG